MIRFFDTIKIASIPVLLASLCCLSPVILVLLGISTVSFASSLADTLYGTYKWAFRLVGIVALIGSIGMYLRRQNICTFDDAIRRRNEVINWIAIAVIAGVLGYMFFLYVVVHYVGVWLLLWQ